jgi:hypothetical protein
MDHECVSFNENIIIEDEIEKRIDIDENIYVEDIDESLRTPAENEYDFLLEQALNEKSEVLKTPEEHEFDFQLEQAIKKMDDLDLKTEPEDLIVVESKIEPEKTGAREWSSFFSFKQIQGLIYFLVILSAAMNGFLYSEYYKYKDQSELFADQYFVLYNKTNSIEAYYENLTSQYSELRKEYINLDNMYNELTRRNAELQSEYDSILSYEIENNLVSGKIIELGPKENYTDIYYIPFSGYITVNYSATGEVYSWVGSSALRDVYYSRNPQFPNTASNHNFTVPVLPDVVLFFANGDEFESVTITYTVNFIY